MMSDGWYGLAAAEAPLNQGDLLFDCPLLAWQSDQIQLQQQDEVEMLYQSAEIVVGNVIVMTQACDLAQRKVKTVTVCPHYTLAEYRQLWTQSMTAQGQNPTEKAWRKQCDSIADGYVWNLSMLNSGSVDGSELPIRVVDFHEIYTLPLSILETLLIRRGKPRPYLLSPYREHLSQAFARYFMRVGLPANIDKEW